MFPRDDYAEMLGWMIWHLGGTPKKFFPLRMPGPDHSARWMAKCIYYSKILACSTVFVMSEEERKQASIAARSYLTFITGILRYYRY